MCRDESRLKDIWISLFDSKISAKIKDLNDKIVGPFILIERAFDLFYELGQNYICSLENIEDIKRKFNGAVTELKISQEKLNEAHKQCKHCEVLSKELQSAKRRATEAEDRVTQIAQILILRPADDDKCAELPTSPNRSAKRKRRCLRDENEVKGEFSSQTVQTGFSSSQTSPKSIVEKPNSQGQVLSPIVYRTPKKSADLFTLWNCGDLEPNGVKTIPRRNLSADFEADMGLPISTKKKKSPLKLDQKGNSEKSDALVDPGNVSSDIYAIKCGFELDKSGFGVDNTSVINQSKNTDAGASSIDAAHSGGSYSAGMRYTHKMNASNSHSKKKKTNLNSCKIVKNSDNSFDLILPKKVPKKKLKQLTLQMRSDKVGTGVESDPDDIVLPSPDKNNSGNGQNQEIDEDIEVAFDPCFTSTQNQPGTSTDFNARKSLSPTKRKTSAAVSSRVFDNSFDVIQDKKKSTPSPNSKYQGKAVRGKANRAKLPGWDCNECKKFYDLAFKNLSPTKVKAKINLCSKHRSKHKPSRPTTPPGFWDIDIPDTPE